MNRTCKGILAAIFFIGLAVAAVQAEDQPVSLVIAPPPVGYPAITAGMNDTEVGVNGVYASYKANDFDLTLLGGNVLLERQVCPSDTIAFNGSAGVTFLAGDQYDLLMASIPFNGDIIFKVLGNRVWSLFAFGGATGNFCYTNMTISVSQPVPYTTTVVTDDTSVTTTLLTVSGLAGLQANVTAGDFIISPFALGTITGGRYTTTITSSLSYSYAATSGSIDPVAGLVLGFDVLYVPRKFALSSQFHHESDYTLITVAGKWLLPQTK